MIDKEKYPCLAGAETEVVGGRTIYYRDGAVDTRFIWCGPAGKMNQVVAWMGEDWTNVRFLANLGREELAKPEVVSLLGESGAVMIADRQAVLRRDKLAMEGIQEGQYGVWLVID